jgi:hypothetical protein
MQVLRQQTHKIMKLPFLDSHDAQGYNTPVNSTLTLVWVLFSSSEIWWENSIYKRC